MIRFELTTDIDAPIERVFDLARDLEFHARSFAHTGEQAIGGKTSGLVEVGDTVTWRARHFGIWWTMTSRITEVERPAFFADEQDRGPFARFRHEHHFEVTPRGTRMVDRWSHASPLGPLGWLVDRLVLGRYMERLLRTRNRALKRELEAPR